MKKFFTNPVFLLVLLLLLLFGPMSYHYLSGKHEKERVERREKLDELIDMAYFMGQKEAMNGNFFIKKTDTGYVAINHLLWTNEIKWYTPKTTKLLYELAEMSFYIGQKDYMEGEIHIEKSPYGSYRWIDSPWDDRQPKYLPTEMATRVI